MPPRPPAPVPAPAAGITSKMRLKPLLETLQAVTTAATTRAEEASLLFSNVASLLNVQLHGEPAKAIPLYLRKSFYAFCQDISTVAERHFESHARGSPRPPLPYTSLPKPNAQDTPPTSTASTTPPSPLVEETTSHVTYASVTRKPPPTAPRASQQPKQKATPKTRPPDNRLFVRLPENHVLRTVSPYSIQNDLNKALGTKLVKEIQTTRTGFALCPLSPETEASLTALIPKITALFCEKGPCVVEKATNLVSYRIASIPRSFQGYENGQVTQIRVTAEHLSLALTDELNESPVQITETRHSNEASYTFSSTWIARFPSEAAPLPRSLLLLGARASIKLLPKKVAVVQCNRCWMWHNERSCARLARCRLCGSTTHIESEHTLCSPIAHPCPPRCFHCHGPHPSDSLECLLRPKPNQTALTKQQKAQIRQSCSAAFLRMKAANCTSLVTPTPSPHAMEVEAPPKDTPTRPSTPPASQDLTFPPTTSQGSRYSIPSPSEQLLPRKRLFPNPTLHE
jgi:hypothetical protein